MDKNITCFEAHKNKDVNCKIENCRYWHELQSNQNCMLNKINEEKDLTLQEVGDLFNITRMRVCQIEKLAISKIKKNNLFS